MKRRKRDRGDVLATLTAVAVLVVLVLAAIYLWQHTRH